ncbi:MAG: PIN domain-containing protein [Acidimicrobiia bacterium]|nr:PIN domain-containing protein [Acidimicrobiia bacterium]
MTALDTNVLIYACDKSDARRQQIALDLIAAATDGVLLWQVACEFIAASRKLKDQGFTPADAWSRLAEFQGVFPLSLPDASIFPRAQELHVNGGVSFWDALIVAACNEVGVHTMYSEDIQARQSFGTLTIVNPFA